MPDDPLSVAGGDARPPNVPSDVTEVLNAAERGDPQAAERLLQALYDELRHLARARMAREPGGGAGMTLQATALVHEAYLRLMGGGGGAAQSESRQTWQNRGHFFGAAALAMRRILVERARASKRLRRGGGKQRIDLDQAAEIGAADADDEAGTDLLALEEALVKLERFDERKAKVVQLRYFGGLTVEETAAALDLSPSTVKNEWAFARAWLHRELSGGAEAGPRP